MTYQNVMTHRHEQSSVRAPNSPEFRLGYIADDSEGKTVGRDGKYKCTLGQPSYIVPGMIPMRVGNCVVNVYS